MIDIQALFVEAVFARPFKVAPRQPAILVAAGGAGCSVGDEDPDWKIRYTTDLDCLQFTSPDGEIINRDEMVKRLRRAASMSFYHIGETSPAWRETTQMLSDERLHKKERQTT